MCVCVRMCVAATERREVSRTDFSESVTRVDSFAVRQLMKEALLVFDVSQVPELHRVVNGGRRQQPITARVKLCMSHFGFVQLVTKNLQHQNKSKAIHSNTNFFKLITIFYCLGNIILFRKKTTHQNNLT